MKALVFDVDINEIVHLIGAARENKEAYVGEQSPLKMLDVPDARVAPATPDHILVRFSHQFDAAALVASSCPAFAVS